MVRGIKQQHAQLAAHGTQLHQGSAIAALD
jgi:hypothetical protein